MKDIDIRKVEHLEDLRNIIIITTTITIMVRLQKANRETGEAKSVLQVERPHLQHHLVT
jgi:hypothetical protein